MNLIKRVVAALALAGFAGSAAAQSMEDGSSIKTSSRGLGGGEAFIEALRDGKIGDAINLLRGKPTLVNFRSSSGRTGLLVAIESRERDWVGYLLQKGADPNLAGGNGDTPLIAAARLGQQEVAEWLVSEGAKVDLANRMGETALIVAVQNRHVPMVRLLVSSGADPDKPDSAAGYSARDYAKRDSRTPELLRLIEAKKPKP